MKQIDSPAAILSQGKKKRIGKAKRSAAAAALAAMRKNPSGGTNGGRPVQPAPTPEVEAMRKAQREYRRKRRAAGKDLPK